MGTCGYRTSVPKWEEAEKALRAQGLTPATKDWPIRVRNWLLAHGAKYEMETGELIFNKKSNVATPHGEIVKTIEEVKKGDFKPDKENDELTKALGNPENPGRTRGFGPSVPWKTGFPQDTESYRSRARERSRRRWRTQTRCVAWKERTRKYMPC